MSRRVPPAPPRDGLFDLWPQALPGHGERQVAARVGSCCICSVETVVLYGTDPFCIACTAIPQMEVHAEELRRVLQAAYAVSAYDPIAGARWVNPGAAEFLEQAVVRLTDELGPETAKAITQDVAQGGGDD
jgi:hypothetical protein